MFNLNLKAMKNVMKIYVLISILCSFQLLFAQKTLKQYVSKMDSKKIQKSILWDMGTIPTTSKSFKDGHGHTPYFTSKDQLPKTVALIAFNIRDLGDVHVTDAGYSWITTYTALSENGGNMVANAIYNVSIDMLKDRFKQEGVTLLTPKEFLDSKEKIDFYYDTFSPEVSKLGDFLRKVETRGTQMSTSADYFRTFDLGAAFDWKRSNSLGSELANKLGVDAVLSVGTVIQSNNKEGYFRSIKIAMHGPNPNPKQDKKYVAQKAGNGYNNGQLYMGLTYNLKDPQKTIEIHKKQITNINFEGYEVLLKEIIDRMYNEFYKAIEKTH